MKNQGTSAKSIIDFTILQNEKLADIYSLISLKETDKSVFEWENVLPGQFIELQIVKDGCCLRRPISVHDVNISERTLYLLVRTAGKQTSLLQNMRSGETLNAILPLGNGFNLENAGDAPLLVGGGVGVAPLLYLGKKLKSIGISPTFLLAAKTKADLLRISEFSKYGDVVISTDDGSMGSSGLVTENDLLFQKKWTKIFCCGPLPMMKGIAKIAKSQKILCEVSLENTMACGLGACLCCVEDTKDSGNVCVCTDGPVFDADRLKW